MIVYSRSGLVTMKTSLRIRSAGLFSTYLLDNQLCSNAQKLCCWENVFSNHLLPRYVSIPAHSISSPLYLCELEVLSPVADHIALDQCGDGAGELEDVTVYSNTCMVLQAKQKMNFSHGLEFCQKKRMAVLHNMTVEDALAYDFVK